MLQLMNFRLATTTLRNDHKYICLYQTKFENFFMLHAHKFSDDEEHKLFYYELYQEFQEMFDNELQTLCDSMCITKEE